MSTIYILCFIVVNCCPMHDSLNTSVTPHHIEIEDDHEEYSIDFIPDVKFHNWSRRRGLYLQFLTNLASFDFPE